MSSEQLASLRADFNPSGVGILWDLRNRWFATTPAAEVIEAASADELRRALRTLDGTTAADAQTLTTAGSCAVVSCQRCKNDGRRFPSRATDSTKEDLRPRLCEYA